MELDHDVHAVADRAADLAERLERLVELGGADVEAARRLGGVVERPDLHAGDALAEQALGQLVGAVQERVEVLVRPGPVVLRQAPVVGQLAAVLAHVAVAGAGVVGADAGRDRPPSSWWIGWPVAWPKMSHSAMSIAEAPRISAPVPEKPR